MSNSAMSQEVVIQGDPGKPDSDTLRPSVVDRTLYTPYRAIGHSNTRSLFAIQV